MNIKTSLHKIKEKLFSDPIPWILLGLVLILAYVNYIHGTWLLGWDSLSDEFNFKINAERQFTGVWNEYQGLGTAGGHAHASDIPRFIYLYLASFLLPVELLRYSYLFVMLYIGALGMYKLSKYLFEKNSKYSLVGLVASLFYIFNLGTLQIFYVPFEMFNTQFAVLPWIFLYIISFLRTERIRDYALLSLFILLGTPQAYAPALFYAQIMTLGLFMFTYLLLSKNKLLVLKRCIYIGIPFLLINLFWFLPNVYFVINYSESVANSQINSLFSEDAFLYSTRWGTFLDFPILRGFLFGWLSYKGGGEMGYLMEVWRQYMANMFVFGLGIGFFVVVITGAIFSIQKKNRVLISLIPVLLISLFMVIGANGIFEPIWGLLRSSMSIFREGLRFPYSKFSIQLQFIYAIFFTYAIYLLVGLLKKKVGDKAKYGYLVVSFLIVIYMIPFFTGNLISKEMPVKLPPEYEQLFDYFEKEDPNERIVYLPANTPFGWQYYDWGQTSYQGAGFIWFGIKQPFVTRDFDRWHPANEDLYNELHYAIYSENTDVLDYLTSKYQIGYIILDESVISPYSERSTFREQTKEIMKNMENVKIIGEFGKMTVYKINRRDLVDKFVYTPDSYTKILTKSEKSNIDSMYLASKNPNYYLDESATESLVFHDDELLSVFNKRQKVNVELKNNKKGRINISVPDFSDDEKVPAFVYSLGSEVIIDYLYPIIKDSNGDILWSEENKYGYPIQITGDYQVTLDSKLILSDGFGQITLLGNDSKVIVFDTAIKSEINLSEKVYSAEIYDCSSGGKGDIAKELDKYPGSVKLIAYNKTSCLKFSPIVKVIEPSIVEVSFDYQTTPGAIISYCLWSKKDQKCVNEKYANRPVSRKLISEYKDYVYVKDPSNLSVRLVLETDNKREIQTAMFKDIIVVVHEVQQVIDISPAADVYDVENTISLSWDLFPITIELPEYHSLNKKYVPGSFYYRDEAQNCDEFYQKDYSRSLVNEGGESTFRYYALDAVTCDFVNTRNIDTNASYLITVDSENITGKRLNFCVSGIGLDKCLIQKSLWDGVTSEVLPSYSAESVSIALKNQSIGRIPTENKLNYIDVKYIPYMWLKGIQVIGDNSGDLENGIKISSVDKKAIYKYRISVDSITETEGLFILNQSYDKGWVLYDKDSCKFGLTTPFTCMKADAEHVLAKNWANGWVVPAKNADYIIIFWPQYLQFGGYIILVMFFGVLVSILAVAKRKSHYLKSLDK